MILVCKPVVFVKIALDLIDPKIDEGVRAPRSTPHVHRALSKTKPSMGSAAKKSMRNLLFEDWPQNIYYAWSFFFLPVPSHSVLPCDDDSLRRAKLENTSRTGSRCFFLICNSKKSCSNFISMQKGGMWKCDDSLITRRFVISTRTI